MPERRRRLDPPHPPTAASGGDRDVEQVQGATRPTLRHVPALDGLRGLAVAAVLCFHGGWTWAVGGYLGVSLFFTLSGFLITSLLLTEHAASGRIALRAFWARRARRLLPAALAALGGILAYGVFAADGDQLRDLRGDVLGALGYVANWRFLVDGRAYSELFEAPSPVQHFWSLAIEEQFYLAFPLVVAGLLALGRGRRALLAVVVCAAAMASTVLMAVLSAPGGDPARAYYGTDTRAAELLAGALLALVVSRRAPAPRPAGRVARVAASLAGPVALAAMAAMWWRVEQVRPWLYDGGFALHALLAVVVIAAARIPGPFAAGLSVLPLRHLGRISYGAYLYHWPVFLWLTPERTGFDGALLFGLRALITLEIAHISFYVLEAPIRTGSRLTAWRPAVVTPAAALTLVAALLLVTASPPAPDIVLAAVNDGPPAAVASPARDREVERALPARVERVTPGDREPSRARDAVATTTTPPSSTSTTVPPVAARPLPADRPVRVLVVGDSVALSLGRGLERWGAATGHASVWNAARMYCSIGRYAERALMGATRQGAGCDDWEMRWAGYVEEFDPDVVVVLSTIWEIVHRRAEGWDDFKGIDDPQYQAWLQSEYDVAVDVLASRGARVAWLTMPCLRRTDDGIIRATDLYNTQVLGDLEERRGEVFVIDIFGRICPDGTFTDTLDGIEGMRPDGAHFSDPGADWVATWLMPEILDPSR
jgi:peptidoglycan/LPS O-acetylase OafA/YrhL